MNLIQYLRTQPEYIQAAEECEAAKEVLQRAKAAYHKACDDRQDIALRLGRAYKKEQAQYRV